MIAFTNNAVVSLYGEDINPAARMSDEDLAHCLDHVDATRAPLVMRREAARRLRATKTEFLAGYAVGMLSALTLGFVVLALRAGLGLVS